MSILQDKVQSVVDILEGTIEFNNPKTGEPMTAKDYVIDALRYTHQIHRDFSYMGSIVTLSVGKEHISIDTYFHQVKGVSRDEKVTMPYWDTICIDEACQELFNEDLERFKEEN